MRAYGQAGAYATWPVSGCFRAHALLGLDLGVPERESSVANIG